MSFARDFAELTRIGADPAGGWSRPAYSAADNAAHDWLMARGRDAGLTVRQDAIGNVILRLEGDGPAIMIGSHLDTVVQGGAYDGAIGVLAGLEVARRLRVAGTPGAPVAVVAFRDEEGRFGPFTGSRAMAGRHDPAALAAARAPDGEELATALAAAGLRAANAPRDWAQVRAYLELHIEQGPVLETAGVDLGIVTAITGQERLALRFTGQADHAGAAPMDLRRDAFQGAARFAVAFDELIAAGRGDDPDLRGTIGFVRVTPNQGNVVPGEVTLGVEVRSTAGATLTALRDRITALAGRVAAERGLNLRARSVYADAPVAMDEALRAVLAEAAAGRGQSALDLPSGANHDAGIIGRLVPAAMLFVPSIGGRSHCPDEETPHTAIEAAIDVLFAAVETMRKTG